jgi:hypothetical protein
MKEQTLNFIIPIFPFTLGMIFLVYGTKGDNLLSGIILGSICMLIALANLYYAIKFKTRLKRV